MMPSLSRWRPDRWLRAGQVHATVRWPLRATTLLPRLTRCQTRCHRTDRTPLDQPAPGPGPRTLRPPGRRRVGRRWCRRDEESPLDAGWRPVRDTSYRPRARLPSQRHFPSRRLRSALTSHIRSKAGEPAPVVGVPSELETRLHLGSVHQALDPSLHRPRAQVQLLADARVGEAGQQQRQHLDVDRGGGGVRLVDVSCARSRGRPRRGEPRVAPPARRTTAARLGVLLVGPWGDLPYPWGG